MDNSGNTTKGQETSLVHILPWLLGWISLTVMGPFIAFRVVYKACISYISNALNTEKELRGKVIVITGASSGLGEALAHCLYRRGSRLILAARNTQKLEEVKENLLRLYKPPEVHIPIVIKLDLEDLVEIPSIANSILKVYGHVDVLINNAGVSYRGAVISTDISVDIKLMVVNYFGQVALTKALLTSMMSRQRGHIIGISSIQGKMSLPFRSCYGASKHAFQAFLDSLRAEIAEHNIYITVVCPGYIKTNLSLNALTGSGNKYGVMDETTSNGMEPTEVAERVVQCILTKEEYIVLCPFLHRIALYLQALCPEFFSFLMKSRARKERKNI